MFDTIFKVFEKNCPPEEDISKISSFVFCQWLGNNPKTIKDANFINAHYDMPMLYQYKLINETYKGQRFYIKFPKKQKDTSAEMELISKHYKISHEKAKEYLELMSKEELSYLKDLYKPKEK